MLNDFALNWNFSSRSFWETFYYWLIFLCVWRLWNFQFSATETKKVSLASVSLVIRLSIYYRHWKNSEIAKNIKAWNGNLANLFYSYTNEIKFPKALFLLRYKYICHPLNVFSSRSINISQEYLQGKCEWKKLNQIIRKKDFGFSVLFCVLLAAWCM